MMTLTSEMASYMITLGAGSATVFPLAGKTEIIGTFAADMVVAKMVIELFWVDKRLGALLPLATVRRCVVVGRWGRRGRGWGGRELLRRHKVMMVKRKGESHPSIIKGSCQGPSKRSRDVSCQAGQDLSQCQVRSAGWQCNPN